MKRSLAAWLPRGSRAVMPDRVFGAAEAASGPTTRRSGRAKKLRSGWSWVGEPPAGSNALVRGAKKSKHVAFNGGLRTVDGRHLDHCRRRRRQGRVE